jgi:branched-chain amino acid transport system ATP-binding protein
LIRARRCWRSRILLVEQNFRFAATVADRLYMMAHGQVVDKLHGSELEAKLADLHERLGV